MKRISKILAMILVIASLFSVFSMSASAASSYIWQDLPSPSNWAYAGVKWAIDKGAMTYQSKSGNYTYFKPDVPVTRGDAVYALYVLAGSPYNNGRTGFTDVPSTSKYAKAVKWAVDNGITNGTSATKFSPNVSLTREQCVTFLYRAYANPDLEYEFTRMTSLLWQFNDSDQVSAYAKVPMTWAVFYGIINGVGNNNLNPKGTMTRAQFATILYREQQYL